MVHGKFKAAYLALVSALLLLLPAVYSSAEEIKYQPSGPLGVRNQQPMYLFYLSMRPERAKVVEKGRLSVETGYHVANNIAKQHDPWPSWKKASDLTFDILIDAEISRFYADIRYGLWDGLDVGINIPYFIYSGGYLDSFIENFEDMFSVIKTPNARETRPRDKYRIKVDHFGSNVINDDSKPNGLGEITLEAKYKILQEAGYWPGLSLRGALKLPTATGNSSKLLGSDEVDYGFGLLADKKLTERLYMYLNFSAAFIKKPEILEKLDVDDYMLSALFGLEFFLTNRTSMLFQALANSSIYEKGVPSMERDSVVLSAGFNHNFTEKVSWQISMDENTNSAAPDFGLLTSLKIKI